MAKMWNDVVKWLEDASKIIGKEAGDLTQKGKLKVEIFDLKRKLHDGFSELGKLVYEMVLIKKQLRWQTKPKVVALVKRIKALQRQLTNRDLEYKKVGKK